MNIKIKHVDVFTNKAFGGNPAGVVVNAEGLTNEQMQKFAQEMQLSETAFIFPPSTKDANIKIRWFTPTTEVSLCGHATIAAFHVLSEENKFGLGEVGEHNLNVETKSGILPIKVIKKEKNSAAIIFFGLPIPEIKEIKDTATLNNALDIGPSDIDTNLPIVKDNLHLIIPLKSLKKLVSISPNRNKVTNICSKYDIIVLAPVTLETVNSTSKVHIRCFAPKVGVYEDPVTGSVHGALGVYLFEQNVIKPNSNGIAKYIGEQGDHLKRPGRVSVVLKVLDKKVESIFIGGKAITVLSGEISI
jgi:PhzF family phenazine biosynthesis protein